MNNYTQPRFGPGDKVMYYDNDKYPVITTVNEVTFSSLYKCWLYYVSNGRCFTGETFEPWFPGKIIINLG